jgi:2'-5' RNA ligase
MIKFAEDNKDQPNGVGKPQDDREKLGKPQDNVVASKDNEEPQSPPESGANKADKEDKEKPDPADKQSKPSVQRSIENDARPEMLQRHTGMMVAFMVKPEIAEQLALPDGEPVEDHHVTLCFLGDRNETPPQDKLNPATSLSVIGTALSTFAQGARPFTGLIGGIGRFINGGDSDAVVALVNAPGLQDFRRRLVDILETSGYSVASDYDYLPHITLKYVDANEPTPDIVLPGSMLADDGGMLPAALIFDEICLAIGDDRYFFPIGKATNDATDALYVKYLEDSLEKSETPDVFLEAGEQPGHPQERNWPWRLS